MGRDHKRTGDGGPVSMRCMGRAALDVGPAPRPAGRASLPDPPDFMIQEEVGLGEVTSPSGFGRQPDREATMRVPRLWALISAFRRPLTLLSVRARARGR